MSSRATTTQPAVDLSQYQPEVIPLPLNTTSPPHQRTVPSRPLTAAPVLRAHQQLHAARAHEQDAAAGPRVRASTMHSSMARPNRSSDHHTIHPSSNALLAARHSLSTSRQAASADDLLVRSSSSSVKPTTYYRNNSFDLEHGDLRPSRVGPPHDQAFNPFDDTSEAPPRASASRTPNQHRTPHVAATTSPFESNRPTQTAKRPSTRRTSHTAPPTAAAASNLDQVAQILANAHFEAATTSDGPSFESISTPRRSEDVQYIVPQAFAVSSLVSPGGTRRRLPIPPTSAALSPSSARSINATTRGQVTRVVAVHIEPALALDPSDLANNPFFDDLPQPAPATPVSSSTSQHSTGMPHTARQSDQKSPPVRTPARVPPTDSAPTEQVGFDSDSACYDTSSLHLSVASSHCLALSTLVGLFFVAKQAVVG
jgi:hypothetical protein